MKGIIWYSGTQNSLTHIWKTHTLQNYNNLLNRGTAAWMIAAVQETLLLCPCCSGHQLVGDDELYDKAKRLSDHYNRDIAITFPAQLLSFRACFRAEIAQQSSVSQFAKMLIVDYHSVTSTFGKVCTALLLFLTSYPLKKQIMHHHFYVWKASFGRCSLLCLLVGLDFQILRLSNIKVVMHDLIFQWTG